MKEKAGEAAPRIRMRGCLTSTILPPGILAGKETVRDCMKDETIRRFLGCALLHEIMPGMGLGREILDPLAMEICREMEEPQVMEPLALYMQGAVRAWQKQALPLLEGYCGREDAPPPCLTMGLSALIMLFSGARREENGRYTYLKNGEACALDEDEEILFSFSRLSCDMPPEALAYAALSDRAIWEKDLREIPGLEELVAEQLRDLQLLGLMGALERASKNHP